MYDDGEGLCPAAGSLSDSTECPIPKTPGPPCSLLSPFVAPTMALPGHAERRAGAPNLPRGLGRGTEQEHQEKHLPHGDYGTTALHAVGRL